MKKPVLPDTDVLVDFLRGHADAVGFMKTHCERIILSSIVVAELYAGVRGDEEQTALDNLVSIFRVAPVTADIARVAGLYKRDHGKSHGVGLADAIVAATARLEGAELNTLNAKHYPMLTSPKMPYRKK